MVAPRPKGSSRRRLPGPLWWSLVVWFILFGLGVLSLKKQWDWFSQQTKRNSPTHSWSLTSQQVPDSAWSRTLQVLLKHQNHLVLFWCSKSVLKKSPWGNPSAYKSSHLELFGSFFEATRHPKGHNLGVKFHAWKFPSVVWIWNTNYNMVDFPTSYVCRKVNLQDQVFLKVGYLLPTPTMLFLPSWESCIFGRRVFLYARVGSFKTLSSATSSKKIKCEFNPRSDVMHIYMMYTFTKLYRWCMNHMYFAFWFPAISQLYKAATRTPNTLDRVGTMHEPHHPRQTQRRARDTGTLEKPSAQGGCYRAKTHTNQIIR